MKKFLSIIAVLFLLPSALIFTGCTYKTYQLIGIVDPETNEIILKKDITDELVLQKIEDQFGDSATIKLSMSDEFVISYTTYITDGYSITHTQVGTFELDKDAEIIKFNFLQNEGEFNSIEHQYTNGRIIYYASNTYFVFE